MKIKVDVGSEEYYDFALYALEQDYVLFNSYAVSQQLVIDFHNNIPLWASIGSSFQLWLHYNYPRFEKYADKILHINGSFVGALVDTPLNKIQNENNFKNKRS